MITACLDLEGVLIPEIWQNVSRLTGVEELMLTTRDIPDYDELMGKRLAILEKRRLTIADIQRAIGTMDPLPGALEFLRELRRRVQTIILSDTFAEFMPSFMEKLEHPTLFCNSLRVADTGAIDGYRLRQPNGKYQAVKAFKLLAVEVRAAGDSYNDLAMIQEADKGALFRAPHAIIAEHPELPAFHEYDGLLRFLTSAD